MKVNIRNDTVEVEGYVNAVERDSKPLYDRVFGRFIERICKGAFRKAIERNDDIHILLNHDQARDLGSTKRGNLNLEEDNIGLKARATITDPDVVTKARNGDLVGWSFGFNDLPECVERREIDGMPHRIVRDLDLREVSILDRNRSPAYEGTLIAARDDSEALNIGESLYTDVEVTETRDEQPAEEVKEQSEIDYSVWENTISELKGEM